MRRSLSLIIIILAGCLIVGCTRSRTIEEATAPPVTIKPTDIPDKDQAQAQIALPEQVEVKVSRSAASQVADRWITAYCNRDGQALFHLLEPESRQLFFESSREVGLEDFCVKSFGLATPWPQNQDLDYFIDNNTISIYYNAVNQEPHAYIWKETLTLEEKDGQCFVVSEHRMEYKAVTTKEVLIEENRGNFNYFRNGLNYIATDLGYQLNQNAIKARSGIYEFLFTPEMAAPYLLNLSGGSCVLKSQNETYTIVTYTFQNNDSIDLLMHQPFGKDGIWLVEDIDVADREDQLRSTEEWYRTITLKKLDQTKRFTNISDLIDNDEIRLLTDIPQDKVALYGNLGEKTILRWNGNIRYFPWAITSPMGIMPILDCADYDGDGEKEVSVILHLGTGTGFSVDWFYLVRQQKDGTMAASQFTPYQYIQQLKERVTAVCDAEDKLQFFIDGEKAGNPIDISYMTQMGKFRMIGFGQQISFHAKDNKLRMNFLPECYVGDVVSPQYDSMPSFTAAFGYSEGTFQITDIQLNEGVNTLE